MIEDGGESRNKKRILWGKDSKKVEEGNGKSDNGMKEKNRKSEERKKANHERIKK